MRDCYPLVSFTDPVIPPAELAALFTSGSFDVYEVNSRILQHPSVVGHAKTPAWRLIWSWFDLPQTEYIAARDRLVKDLTDRALTHPGEILHAAGSALGLDRYGDALFRGQGVEDYFKDYLADLESFGTLIPAPGLFGVGGGSFAGLTYNENDTKEFAAIHGLVAAASSAALDRQMAAEAPALLASLADSEKVGVLHEWGRDKGNYGGTAILHHISVSDFADLALVDGKPNDKLMAALKERHRQGYNIQLAPELPWLGKLRAEISRRAAKLLPPYGMFAKARMDYWFQDLDPLVAAAMPSPAKSPSKSVPAGCRGGPRAKPGASAAPRKAPANPKS